MILFKQTPPGTVARIRNERGPITTKKSLSRKSDFTPVAPKKPASILTYPKMR
jgi:hypothetical protein